MVSGWVVARPDTVSGYRYYLGRVGVGGVIGGILGVGNEGEWGLVEMDGACYWPVGGCGWGVWFAVVCVGCWGA